ncbi:hypothetical protein JW766_05730 [Candidatus Dojkabacteria bacterium]|nr:hypothetical protein [Candidatus Dojkabacteria bacterium]
MKKYLIYYILLLFVTFLLVLIVWPNRWINIDMGNFHYHKMWEGLKLSDLTFGVSDKELDLDMGRDFTGGSEYRVKVLFDEGEEEKLQKVRDATDLIRLRFEKAGYPESSVNYTKEGEEFFLVIRVEENKDEFEEYKTSIFARGKFEVWGEKLTPTEGDEGVIIGEDEDDPIKAFLKQSYDSLNIDGNQMKGFKVSPSSDSSTAGLIPGSEEEVYDLRIILDDHQVNELTNNIYVYFGKSIIGVLDSQILPIDGKDLGETLQTYGKALSIQIAGLPDEKIALIYGAIIQYGPLPVELEADEGVDIAGSIGQDILQKILLGCTIVAFLSALVMIVLYKYDGVIGLILVFYYGLFVIACLKLFSVKITMVSVLALITTLGVFIGMLFKVIQNSFRENKRTEGQRWDFTRSHEILKLLLNVTYASAIILLIFKVFALWNFANVALAILIGISVTWLIVDLLLPLSFKLVTFFKE